MARDGAQLGRIAAGPIVAAIERWAAKEGLLDARDERNRYDRRDRAAATLSERTGIHRDFIADLRAGRAKWINFDAADRLILEIEQEYGWFHPELRELYESFDFRWIDIQKPTTSYTEVDRLRDEGLNGLEIAAHLGVSKTTVYNALKRSEACAA